jgi:hypothetical protein
VPAYQTEQLMLWGDGQSRTGDPNKKKKISGDDLPDCREQAPHDFGILFRSAAFGSSRSRRPVCQ